MQLEKYLGQIFTEKEFYDLLLFDIEAGFRDEPEGTYHFYFDRLMEGKIQVRELIRFQDRFQADKIERQLIEKKEWFHISFRVVDFVLALRRLNRKGWVSVFYLGRSATQESHIVWLDEYPDKTPLTPEDWKLGLKELAGVLEDHIDRQKKSGNKGSMQ